jgi:glycosyltransferase involved in cell wall biosynthesis
MEKLLVEFARHTNRRRFDLNFIALGSRGRLADDLERERWPVTALKVRPGLRPGLILRLARLFRDHRADIVHTHNSKPLIYAGPAAWLARTPVLMHTRHGQRFQSSPGASTLFRLASRLTTRVVSVSEDGARLTSAEGMPSNRVLTIQNGIDTERFHRTGPSRDGPAVMVGRLSPEKDVATLLRAADRVRRTLPRFQLEIAGDGECMTSLRALADDLRLGEHVRFLGEIRNISALLSRASLFVLASLTEGISLTVLEAMATGLPVVATRVGGNPEVIVDTKTGLLVPAQDPAALADAIVGVLKNPLDAEKMGQAGRERVEAHFDVRVMVANYERLYGELLRMRPSSDLRNGMDLQTLGSV